MLRIVLATTFSLLIGWKAAAEGPRPAPDMVVDSVVLTIARQAEVPAREEGLLTELLVREGQVVKAGQLLAKLDDEGARLAQQKAELDLERAQRLAENDTKVRLARKQLEIAQAELRRATQAADLLRKSVTAAELDRLRLDVERESLAVEQAEFELATARMLVRVQENELQSAMEKTRRRSMYAPLDGTVVEVTKRPGEWLKSGDLVVRVIATDTLRAEGFVPAEQLVGQTLMGRKVHLSLHLPALKATKFSGEVVFVSLEVDPVTGQARMWAEIDNRNGSLYPGLSGTLSFTP